MSITVGLTGPTGAGKSAASAAALKMGIKVIDCDRVAREAVKKGSKGLCALISVFGDDILLSDGQLNRARLAERAFSSDENTALLNKTILPFISELVRQQMDCEKILLDAPTLFESGLDSVCDCTIAVLADEKVRLKRIIARDNLTLNEAKRRISAGKSDNFFIKNADYVIYNNTNGKEFINEAEALFKKIFGGR